MTVTEKRFTYKGEDGETIAAFKWTGSAKPKAAIQIAHGAGEHSLRYLEPLTPIIEAGYVIYSADHRGHGLTAGPNGEKLGDFGPGGRAAAITDMAVLSKLIRKENPDLPLVLLGHSMGAGFSQAYILDHHKLIDALILSGTAAAVPPPAGTPAAAPTASNTARTGWNASFPNPRTEYDWLSRDEKEVDKYIADPLCGIRFKPPPEGTNPPAARAYDPALMKQIDPNMPVYVFVGDEDPINAKLTRITPLMDRFKEAGIKNATLKVYPGGRHEMLNETNRDEVVADLKAWLDKNAAR